MITFLTKLSYDNVNYNENIMHQLSKSKNLHQIRLENKTIRSTDKCFIRNNPEFKEAIKSFGFIKLCRKYYELT